MIEWVDGAGGVSANGKAVSKNVLLETSPGVETTAFLLTRTAAITAQLHLTRCQ